MTTRQTIEDWLKRADSKNATHVIVVCDSFDHEDYPVFVAQGEDIHARIAHFQNAPMQRVMEVYNMSLPIADQLAEYRAYHP
jgi:hypothetical protein